MPLKEQFRRIGRNGTEYRGVPFWSWNDELDTAELLRQIWEMAKAGLGGHFMHARKGLITPYMGPEWMECIRAAVAASEQAGIKAWLYDEDCWPSGSASHLIPSLNEEYVAKALCWEQVSPVTFKPLASTIATFLVKAPGGTAPEIREIDPRLAPRKARSPEQLLHFYHRPTNPDPQARYTDLLNPRAVKEFIQHTYVGYQKVVGKHFGKTIPGIFTDEPQWAQPVPWSPELPGFFRKLKGYELLPNLPLLIYDVGDFKAFRYDFWHAATELFVASFTAQIGEWCRKKKLAFTGHLNAEDSLDSQMHNVGAAMPHYEHMQIPGIDHLMRRIGDPLLCKQVSSVAHQFGGRRVLSEMFGCAGWNVSFEELKWIAEWQFAQGIDLVCQHLSLYSMRGCRKRDYPPSLHFQQPWWNEYKLLNDHFARLTFMLTRGRHVADVLLLHNIESAWAAYSSADKSAVQKFNEELVRTSRALLGMHYDFDFGDETILARHGRIAGKKLRVKSCAYAVVIVPPCLTIRSTTLRLLERLLDVGGKVILAGPPPERLDGRASDQPAAVLARAVQAGAAGDALAAELRKVLPPRIEVLGTDGKDATGIYIQQRDVNLEQVYFLANTSRDNSAQATIRFPGTGRLERWDTESGDIHPLRTRKRGKYLETVLDFEPMGSHLLVLTRHRKPAVVRPHTRRTIAEVSLGDSWSLSRSEPNALTLDHCSYRIGDGPWSAPTYVLTVQDNLRHIAGSEVCEFKYAFDADFSAKRPQFVHLVIERPEDYEISMNGLPVPTPASAGGSGLGWWRDISFNRLDVSSLVKPQSRNEVVLRRIIMGEAERKRLIADPETSSAERNRLRYGPEIESIYVIGEFLVESRQPYETLDRRALRTRGGFVLVDNWTQAKTGDLVQQGLPFYAGRVRLTQRVWPDEKHLKAAKGATLSFDPPDAITTTVYVNGRRIGTRAWRPYEFEVGGHLQPGWNEISIELAGSCRNLLGPHHHIDGELYSVGPGSFGLLKSWVDRNDAPGQIWTDAYSFVRFGLLGPVRLVLWK